MFRSKQRPIVIPQWEHQKLAGTLVLLWGNDAFDQPPIPRESFLVGVGLHDRIYGALDAIPLGGLPEAEWMALTRRGFDLAWADPIADLIAKMHLTRLIRNGESAARQRQATEQMDVIRSLADRHGVDLATLERIDRITDLCDRIAFDTCFEAPSEGSVRILPRNAGDAEVAVRYRHAGGVIQVSPWPFGVESHTGYLVGFQGEGYPEAQEPALLPYQLVRGAA